VKNCSFFCEGTRDVQFDEKWSFVGKKEKNCLSDEQYEGDCWDHVAYDPEHKLVISVVPGKRTTGNADKVVKEFHDRTGGHVMNLMTTDEYKPYKGAILKAYGEEVNLLPTGKPGRPKSSKKVIPQSLNYATVHKTRENGRVVAITINLIFGVMTALLMALAKSAVSKVVNTAFVERQNGTDRNRNARKVRKTYCFSKDWDMHLALTYLTMYSYNFCWPVRTLRIKGADGCWRKQTPAMSAKLTDHVWSLHEWLTFPVVQRK
jgi:IS1 family transposase